MRSKWLLLLFFILTALGGTTSWGFPSGNQRSAVVIKKPEQQALLRHQQMASCPRTPTALHVLTEREPDRIEMMLGGVRYEMVPLPDMMCNTTVFVGNFCEFVHDEDLSQLFQAVSQLQSLPACVIRKANMQSLRYGFVSFLTVQEKEAAILRFHGSQWRGKQIKVEAIRDHPRFGRVRVPERMVSYVSGALKKTRKGQVNSMRTARGADDAKDATKHKKPKPRRNNGLDLSSSSSTVSAHQNGHNNSPSWSNSKLTVADRHELDLAARKGYLTLDGRDGHASLANLCSSQSLKGSRIAVAHRQWCDEQGKPNIILYKASGRSSRQVLDHLVVDLSPLRDQVSRHWTDQILRAAESAGMNLCSTADTDECATHQQEDVQVAATAIAKDGHVLVGRGTQSISCLPFISLGFFVGERSNAKAMAKELARLWDLPRVEEVCDDLDDVSDSPMPHDHRRDGYKNNHGINGKKTIHNAQDRRRAQRRKIRRDDWEYSLAKSLKH